MQELEVSQNAARVVNQVCDWFGEAADFEQSRTDYVEPYYAVILNLPKPTRARFQFSLDIDPLGNQHQLWCRLGSRFGGAHILLFEQWIGDDPKETQDFIDVLARICSSTTVVFVRNKRSGYRVQLLYSDNGAWRRNGGVCGMAAAKSEDMKTLPIGRFLFGSLPILT